MTDPSLRHVDPELRGVLAALPDLGTLSDATLPGIRNALMGTPAALGTDADGVRVRRVTVQSAQQPELSALLYEPPAGQTAAHAALLDLHGGGFVAGSAQREDASMRGICSALGCVILVPDYRLAPEHPFPAALDDANSALEWLHANADDLSIDAARIGVRGVSAGGGLALSLALRNRDLGGRSIQFLKLVYPMLDDRTPEHAICGRQVWTHAANAYGWNALLRGHDRSAPPRYAVPARATRLSGLPPVFIGVGSIDLFLAENLEFARRLADAGVPLELHVYPGAYHGFALVSASRCAQALERDGLAWLGRAMNERGWASTN